MKQDDFIDMVINYLTTALASFESDPADSDYQRGYRDALVEFMITIEQKMKLVVAIDAPAPKTEGENNNG